MLGSLKGVLNRRSILYDAENCNASMKPGIGIVHIHCSFTTDMMLPE